MRRHDPMSAGWWRACGLLLALVMTTIAARAQTEPESDPPGRVGRIAVVDGAVSWFDIGEGRWSEAQRNRPLTTGDRLSTGRDASAELRIGSTTIKLGEATEIELLRLDDERIRVQLHRGSLALRLRSPAIAAETEFGTDEAWLLPRRGGLYRIDREDGTTFASTWRGEMVVDGDATLVVDPGRRLQLWREGPAGALRHRWTAPVDDRFAARVLREDRDDERSASASHVSPETTGFEDLDRHGRWDRHPEYGAVWIPYAVGDDWAPYRHGRWAWVRPWGWTWIDDAPWGFAPFHYGRWAHWGGRWVWVPGSYVARPVYAPALVAWIDGPSFGIGARFGGPTLSWVPLAPWELFRPYYRVSPRYHDRVNTPDHRRWWPPPRGGANRDGTWGHQGVPGAVTVVPADRLRPPRAGRDDRTGRDDRSNRDDRSGRDDRGDRGDRGDRDRRDDRDDTRPPRSRSDGPPPPPPTRPLQPLPSRVQPQQPATPATPRPPRVAEPTPTRPPLVRDERDGRGRGAAPAPPPPPAALTPLPARPQAPAEPRPREREPERERDEGRGRGALR